MPKGYGATAVALLFAYGELNKTEIEEQRSDDSEASGSSTQEGFECKMFSNPSCKLRSANTVSLSGACSRRPKRPRWRII
jgi:hypothetical protein